MTTEKRINLRVTAEFHKRCEDEAWRRRTTLQQAGVTLFEQWLSGESTTTAKAIAPSTSVREDTVHGIQARIDSLPAPARQQAAELLRAIADLLATASIDIEGTREIDERREREEIERRERALAEIAGGTGGTADPHHDKARKPPARAATKKR